MGDINTIGKLVDKWSFGRGFSLDIDSPARGGDFSAQFGYNAGGQFFLNCSLTIDDSIGIVSINGFPDFVVPAERIEVTNKFCGSLKLERGHFVVIDTGNLIFITSRGYEQGQFDQGLLDEVLDCMEDAVVNNALAIVQIVNSN
jgi:hypothetical protein